MQTFMPLIGFKKSAKSLDPKRCSNQPYEASVILKTLDGSYYVKNGWAGHVAVRMWKGYEEALAIYGLQMLMENQRRAFPSRLSDYHWSLFHLFAKYTKFPIESDDDSIDIAEELCKKPRWFGYEPLHASHRSNLLRKNENYYRKFGWIEPTDYEYVWPTKIGLM